MSIEVKEDRRVRKTKRALRDGLAELLTEKSIQKITVRELVDKVDIHRSTFYTNYTDIYDLYEQISDTIIQEISDIFSENYAVNSKVFLEILFNYIFENQQICNMYLGKNVCSTFHSRLTNLLKEAYRACWSDEYGFTGTDEALEYYVHFHLSGSLAVIGMWADRKFEYSIEQLVKIFTDMEVYFKNFINNKFV